MIHTEGEKESIDEAQIFLRMRPACSPVNVVGGNHLTTVDSSDCLYRPRLSRIPPSRSCPNVPASPSYVATAGNVKVALSGPSGFVFAVEAMLEDMGVPKEAIVILD